MVRVRGKGGIGEALKVMTPLVLAMAANAVNQFVDRLFLAHYSDAAIEGSLPGGMLGWLFICFAMSTVAYSGTFVAQYHGAGNPRSAVRSLGQGLYLSLMSIPFFAALIPLGNWLFSLTGAAQDVIAAEISYFDVMMAGAVFNVAGAVLGGYFAGIRRTRIAGLAVLAGNLSNIPLDWLFIFGKGPLPQMGIEGAAVASVIAQAVTCIILGCALAWDSTVRSAGARRIFRFIPRLSARILKFGFPSGVHVALDCFTFTVFVMMTARLDSMSLAVSNIVFAINHISFAPLCGMGQAAGVMVGNCQGAADHEGARRAGWSCVIVAWAYFAFFAVFIFTCGGWLMDLFHAEASSFDADAFRTLGCELMAILVTWGLFDATDIVLSGALKGAGDTRFVLMTYGSIGCFAWMPAFIAIMHFSPDIRHLWLTMPAYCGVCALVIVGRWIKGRWMKIKLVE